MESKLKKACKVMRALSKLTIEIVSFIGWVAILIKMIAELFN